MGAHRTMLNIQARIVISPTLSETISPRETQLKWLRIYKRRILPASQRDNVRLHGRNVEKPNLARDISIEIMNYLLLY